MRLDEKIVEIFKQGYVCDNCCGRMCGNLLSGMTNKERGRILRHYLAFLLDSGEKLDVDLSNFYGIKFRNLKLEIKKPEKCKICKNFFPEELNEFAQKIVKKLKCIEFDTFLIGSVLSDELAKEEEKIWSIIGIEHVESLKSEINRELGKIVEKLTKKTFDLKNSDVTIVVDLETNNIKIQIRSLYVFGRYQKLVRGVPQTKWICSRCQGKGCTF